MSKKVYSTERSALMHFNFFNPKTAHFHWLRGEAAGWRYKSLVPGGGQWRVQGPAAGGAASMGGSAFHRSLCIMWPHHSWQGGNS